MKARTLLWLRGAWLCLLVWPYALASGVPRPLAVASLPLILALLSGEGNLLFALRIAAALAIGALASLPKVSWQGLQQIWLNPDPRVLTAFVTSVLLWFTALLGWQVFRDATSRTRLLWLWLMGTVVLGLNHRFWGVAADVPTLAFIGIGLFLIGVLEDAAIRWPLALASLLPLLGAVLGVLPAPATPATLSAQDARALNLSGLRVAVTPAMLPRQVNINQPVALPTTPLLSVAGAPRPAYWQEAVYNRFSGSAWIAPASARTPTPLTPPLLQPAATGFPTSIWNVRVTQFFPGSIGPLIYTGTPLAIQSDGGAGYEVPASRALYLPGVSAYGLTLAVPRITESALLSASYPSVVNVPPGDLSVPSSLRKEIAPLAARLKAGNPGPWQLAAHIAQYLDTHEAYDPNFSPSSRGDPIGRFLLRTHRGYCDQFSTAFIMLARLDGLPARWVVGFAPGSYDPATKTQLLLAKDAHSWAEVYLDPYGWVPIDPTPSAASVPTNPSKTPVAPPAAAPRPQGDILAALIVLALATGAYLATHRRRTLPARVRRLDRAFQKLCPLSTHVPPTLRERFLAQPPALQEVLWPVLLVLEQARYGETPPGDAEVRAAEETVRSARAAQREPRS